MPSGGRGGRGRGGRGRSARATDTGTEIYKRRNIFGRFSDWLASLFKGG